MKNIVDPALTITITNNLCNYDLSKDKLLMHTSSITKYRKNGYLTFDENGREIGIVYMADDKRANRYLASEILFFKKYQEEYGTWRVIILEETYSKYLMYSKLQEILKQRPIYTLTTASRIR